MHLSNICHEFNKIKKYLKITLTTTGYMSCTCISAEVAGNWNIQRGNTVRYTAESQISFQLRRRLAGNMTRSFANHFARRTVYIGSRNPSQHHRRRVFVDRNELHFDSAEHSVLDEEPLNSAEYAQRSKPFRSDRGLGERRV